MYTSIASDGTHGIVIGLATCVFHTVFMRDTAMAIECSLGTCFYNAILGLGREALDPPKSPVTKDLGTIRATDHRAGASAVAASGACGTSPEAYPTRMASTAETLRLLEAYGEAGDQNARAQLVINYTPLVRRLCGRFRISREPQEDLFQVGVIGLLNAIEKFDPTRGSNFSSLVIPEVLGAILNYLRDHGSLIKTPRALRQQKLRVEKASERMAARMGRWPTVAELALECDLSEEDVYDTMELARNGEPSSLDSSMGTNDADDSSTLSDFLGCEDHRFDLSLDRMTLATALNTLPDRQKRIVTLRFYHGLSQRQTAKFIGVSQMHVSRLERSALVKLRHSMQSHGVAPARRL
jgi:RNA polymerase sigma-B factor